MRSYKFAGSGATGPDLEEQFELLIAHLGSFGFSMSNQDNSEFYISMNHNQKAYSKFIGSGGDKNKCILVLLEPPAVFPAQYLDRTISKYGLVLRPGSADFDNENFLPWPYENVPNPLFPRKMASVERRSNNEALSPVTLQEWRERDFNLVMINANKVSPSKVENYSLRRKFAHSIPPESISVFGYMWSDSFRKRLRQRLGVIRFSVVNLFLPNFRNVFGNFFWRFPSALGTIENKQDILKKSRFALVIENDNTYVSEKIIDCFINGCIPIYYGYDLKNAGIPSEAFLNLTTGPNELTDQLKQLTDKDISSLLTEAANFVNSQSFHRLWNADSVYQIIAKRIRDFSEVADA